MLLNASFASERLMRRKLSQLSSLLLTTPTIRVVLRSRPLFSATQTRTPCWCRCRSLVDHRMARDFPRRLPPLMTTVPPICWFTIYMLPMLSWTHYSPKVWSWQTNIHALAVHIVDFS